MTRLATRLGYKERLFRVLGHIQKHLDDPLDLDHLSAIACFSPYHFHRIFRAMTGETISDHVRRLRLERAATQLRDRRRTILDIALEAGYESHAAFTRAFKQWCGKPPARFRGDADSVPRSPGKIAYGQIPDPASFHIDRKEERMLEINIRDREPFRVAYLRHVGPYDACGSTWERLLTEMGSRGYLGGQNQMIGICHDDPEETPPDQIRYDACLTVDPDFVGFDDIGIATVEGGPYAVATHIGPYSELGKTYTILFGSWLEASGRELRSHPAFEIYLTDPENTEPEEMITEIYMPLEVQS